MTLIEFLRLVEDDTGGRICPIGVAIETLLVDVENPPTSMSTETWATAINICVDTHKANSNENHFEIAGKNAGLAARIDELATASKILAVHSSHSWRQDGREIYWVFSDCAAKVLGVNGDGETISISPFVRTRDSSFFDDIDLMTLWNPDDQAVGSLDLDEPARVKDGYKLTRLTSLLRAILATDGESQFAENLGFQTACETCQAMLFADNNDADSQITERSEALSQFIFGVFEPWGQMLERIWCSKPGSHRRSDYDLTPQTVYFRAKERPKSRILEIAVERLQRRKRLMQRAYIGAFLIAHEAPKDLLALI